MLDKKDLDAIEKMFDKKFLEVEDRLEKKFNKKLADMDAKFNQRFDLQIQKLDTQDKKLNLKDKKLDFLTDCYKDNLEYHMLYDNDLSRINSKLFDHDLRLVSLERKFTTVI